MPMTDVIKSPLQFAITDGRNVPRFMTPKRFLVSEHLSINKIFLVQCTQSRGDDGKLGNFVFF